MNSNDQNKFKEITLMITETYGDQFTGTKLKLWWNMFKPYSMEDFESAVYKHLTCPDAGMFSPKPANIMKFIVGNSNKNEQAVDDKANHSWHVIQEEVKRIGSYGTLKLEDKQALAAVKAVGGWKYICSLESSKLTWVHKEFIAAYKNYERTPLEALPDNLPGRIDLHNHKKDQQNGIQSIKQGIDNYMNK